MDTAMHMHRPSRRATATRPRSISSDLCFFYGATKALKNITLPLMDRKVTAFIGPSGCGKSTLLRAINRIYRALSQPACRRRSHDGRREHPEGQGPQSAARPHRHGVPEADAVSHVDL